MRTTLLLTFLFLSLAVFASDPIIMPSDYLSERGSWTKIAKSEERSIRILISLLDSTTTGANVLKRAREKAGEKGQTIYDVVKAAEGSLTDTTLIRKFSADSPDQITYDSKSVVYLNRDLSVKDALLDLAHELTHYAERTPFNPYELNFSLTEFVISTIEGRGGEADAYLIECQVNRDLEKGHLGDNSNCQKIIDHNEFSKEKTVNLFYQIGKYESYFDEQIKKYGLKRDSFVKVGDQRPEFISSAYNLPYPVAAIFEYMTIMEKACENDQKRLTIMRGQVQDRKPAALSLEEQAKRSLFTALSSSYKKRCEHHVNTDQIATIYSGTR